MFLKRSLVMMAGILLFIGAFLLRFHLADAHLEETFQGARAKYHVDRKVLTLPYDRPAAPPAPAPSPAAPAPSAPAENATVPPGSASDTNVIIGPVPPSAPAAPAPTPEAAPAPDTNSGPMMPPASTLNYSRGARLTLLALGAQPAAATNSEETNAEGKETAPEPPAVAVPAKTNETARTHTNAPSAATNGAPVHVVSHAASAGGRAIVLGYHQFTGPGVSSKNIYSMTQDVFESEMKYLHDNNYHVVPLSDVVRFVKHEIGLPPNAVAITIDDGYKSSIVYAAPVLKKYGYPWTYFVYPAFITRTEGKGAASWPDLVELEKEGVDVECHSMTHPQLSRHRQLFTETPAEGGGSPVIRYGRAYHQLSEPEYADFLANETSGAKEILEKELNKKIRYFAYPYGDFNKQVEARTVAAGYDAIFTVADNPVHITTDVHSIGRYIITRPVERNFAAYLRQGALGLAQVDPAPGATTGNPRPVITAVLGFTGDPASLETEVRDFGVVRHDFDPETSTVRIYLPRDLIQPNVIVSIRAKDEQSGQTMVANWHFNYEPSGTARATHEPIAAEPSTNAAGGGEAATAPMEPATNRTEAPETKAETKMETNAPPETNAVPAAGATNSTTAP